MADNQDWAKPRSSGISYQELLKSDTHPVPDILKEESAAYMGSDDVPVERYISKEFHDLEVEKLWSRVWQMACREEELPEPGDHVVYEIADASILVTRTEEREIKAYHNACLHRGRQLRESSGRVRYFRCPFHGFAWNLDGSLREIPCQWDFPHVDEASFRLPEVKVGLWGGYVFINFDPDCEPLLDYLGELPRQFERWPHEYKYKSAHVAKILRCNWKVAQEAFMEAFHVVATHPQMLAGIGDANSQYDVYGNFTRAITPNGTPSPHITWGPSEQDMFDAMTDRRIDEPPLAEIPEGTTARQFAAMGARQTLRPVLGDAVDRLSDAELIDSFYYTVFPNFHPWGAYNRITYRFRPYENDPDRCIMEVMYLEPFKGERPPPAPIHWLGPDDDWTEAPELGLLARVFNQDTHNLPKVQRGLHAAKKPGVTLGNYQETKIRHFHRMLERYLGA